MIRARELEQFFQAARDRRVLVVGDLLLDRYVRGQASRISPEAPVQVVRVDEDEMRLGGAGNVARNLLALGASVRLCAAEGPDSAGEELERQIQALRIGGWRVVEEGRTTSQKTRILAGGQQVLRVDRETTDPLSPTSEAQFVKRLEEHLDWAEAVFVSDYSKGLVTDRVLAAILPASEGRPVYVDPRGRDFTRFRGATLLKPNLREAEIAAGLEISDEKSLDQAGLRLLEACAAEALLVTRGGHGMSLFRRGRARHDVPALTRDVFDVTGAGDTVLACAGLGHLCGLGLEGGARLATLAAGVVIQKVGAAIAEISELEAAVGLPRTAGKTLDADEAAAVLRAARRQGNRVVFTNGCFDLLHAGHVDLLRRARALGDLLVVGLNTDRTIRLLKGPLRPLIAQHERAHMLGALDAVDMVVLFDEPTPLQLIEALRPDVLVKGGDYTHDQVVGAELVEGWGGRVELVPLTAGKSTSRLIEQIVERYASAGLEPEPLGDRQDPG
jgi:D-beta-D-heptose 7-phosphate kinase / D-beta-D-heptose 1-phosphate adenosyltransferase